MHLQAQIEIRSDPTRRPAFDDVNDTSMTKIAQFAVVFPILDGVDDEPIGLPEEVVEGAVLPADLGIFDQLFQTI